MHDVYVINPLIPVGGSELGRGGYHGRLEPRDNMYGQWLRHLGGLLRWLFEYSFRLLLGQDRSPTESGSVHDLDLSRQRMVLRCGGGCLTVTVHGRDMLSGISVRFSIAKARLWLPNRKYQPDRCQKDSFLLGIKYATEYSTEVNGRHWIPDQFYQVLKVALVLLSPWFFVNTSGSAIL